MRRGGGGGGGQGGGVCPAEHPRTLPIPPRSTVVLAVARGGVRWGGLNPGNRLLFEAQTHFLGLGRESIGGRGDREGALSEAVQASLARVFSSGKVPPPPLPLPPSIFTSAPSPPPSTPSHQTQTSPTSQGPEGGAGRAVYGPATNAARLRGALGQFRRNIYICFCISTHRHIYI